MLVVCVLLSALFFITRLCTLHKFNKWNSANQVQGRFFDLSQASATLSLVTCNVVSSHLIRAHGKNRTKRPVRCLVDEECQCPDKIEHWELPPSESDLCAECITHQIYQVEWCESSAVQILTS